MLLPLLYCALIAAIAYGIYWHIGNHEWFTDHLRGVWGLVIYAAPIITGVILVFFMSRPFFTRRQKPPDLMALSPEAEPELFEFVRAICRIVQAPLPERILIDWQVNASASLHGGLGSLFRRKLDLTIGLPLVRGLSVVEFGGVLAHEFGHFAQSAGMRLTFLIRSMNLWLARIAYQPNDLERQLTSSGLRRHVYGQIILISARIGIWTTRLVLHGIVLLGHIISCLSLRQMEFDADRYGAIVSGPDRFAAVTKRLRLLTIAWSDANQLALRAFEEQKLPNDLSELTIARLDVVSDYSEKEIDRDAEQQRTGWFHTHPSDAERIAKATTVTSSIAFSDDRPAQELFCDFSDLSREVTLFYYRLLGLPLNDVNLVDVEQTCAGLAFGPSKLSAVRAYFSNRLSASRRIVVDSDELIPFEDNATARATIHADCQEWNQALADSKEAFEQFQDAQNQIAATRQALALTEARIRFKPKDLKLASRSQKEILSCHERAIESQKNCEPPMQRFEKAVRRRLTDALRLPNIPGRTQKITTTDIIQFLKNFEPVAQLTSQLEKDFEDFVTVYAAKKPWLVRRPYNQKKLELTKVLNDRLQALDPLLHDLIVPGEGAESLLARIARRLPREALPSDVSVLSNVGARLGEINHVYYQVVGDLCLAAQTAEAEFAGVAA